MMLHVKWWPFHLLPVIFLISSTLFSLSHGASRLHDLQTNQLQGFMRRHVLEVTNGEAAHNGTLVLAAKRTYRKDPLDNFNYYKGGWNITDKHYVASAAFTAAPFIIIAIVWFVILGLFIFIACICCYCCRRGKHFGYSRTTYVLSLIFLILFTITAIIGCAILYTGQGRFYNSVGDTLGYLVQQAKNIFNNLEGLLNSLQAVKQIKVGDKSVLPPSLQETIDKVNSNIHSVSNLPVLNSTKVSDDLNHVLRPARHVVNVFAAVMLFLAFLGFLFSLCGLQFLVYILVIVGWILVTFTLILCGLFLVFHNIVADTCDAMNQWVQNPTADSALSQMLPCMNNETAQQTMNLTKVVTYQMADLANVYINGVTNKDIPPNAGLLYHNQSGPLLPILCNPLDSKLNKRECAHGEVDLANATNVWKNYVCQVSTAGICTTTGRLTPSSYDQLSAVANTSHALDHYSPFLVSLVDCSFVRDTFKDISENNCPGLKLTTKWIYAGLFTISASIMFSLICWLIYVRERQRILHNHKYPY